MPTEQSTEQSAHDSVSVVLVTTDLYDSIHKKIDESNKDEWMTHELADKIISIIGETGFFKAYVESNVELLEKLGYVCRAAYDIHDENNPLNYDLSGLEQEKKQQIVDVAVETAGLMLMKTFYSLKMKSYIRTEIINDADNTKYSLELKKITDEPAKSE